MLRVRLREHHELDIGGVTAGAREPALNGAQLLEIERETTLAVELSQPGTREIADGHDVDRRIRVGAVRERRSDLAERPVFDDGVGEEPLAHLTVTTGGYRFPEPSDG